MIYVRSRCILWLAFGIQKSHSASKTRESQVSLRSTPLCSNLKSMLFALCPCLTPFPPSDLAANLQLFIVQNNSQATCFEAYKNREASLHDSWLFMSRNYGWQLLLDLGFFLPNLDCILSTSLINTVKQRVTGIVISRIAIDRPRKKEGVHVYLWL